MFKIKGVRVGDVVHLDPFAIPQLKIIIKEEADKIANSFPAHEFIVTGPENFKFKSFTDYVKKVKR